jgi:hypothetical protein
VSPRVARWKERHEARCHDYALSPPRMVCCGLTSRPSVEPIRQRTTCGNTEPSRKFLPHRIPPGQCGRRTRDSGDLQTLSYELRLDEGYNTYLRGKVYLQLKDGQNAAAEFQKILDHPGLRPVGILRSLVPLYMGRAHALAGKTAATFESCWSSTRRPTGADCRADGG